MEYFVTLPVDMAKMGSYCVKKCLHVMVTMNRDCL